MTGSALDYITDLIHHQKPVRQLRSSSQGLLDIPPYYTEFYGARAFSSPYLCKSIPTWKQRRSQVSLAGGGLTEFQGGGINLNTYGYGKSNSAAYRGGLKYFQGGWAPPPRPPVATGLHESLYLRASQSLCASPYLHESLYLRPSPYLCASPCLGVWDPCLCPRNPYLRVV